MLDTAEMIFLRKFKYKNNKKKKKRYFKRPLSAFVQSAIEIILIFFIEEKFSYYLSHII